MRRAEITILAVFALVAGAWMTSALHHLNFTVVAFAGVTALFLTNVLTWNDITSERPPWDVFIWYGGFITLAGALGKTGITERFAQTVAGYTGGWAWPAALAVLMFVYFFAHNGFASITAHVTAMFIPFLVVLIGAGVPPPPAVLFLAYFSNLSASLTHFGTTTSPIFFGANYVSQRDWWRLGLIVSAATICIWTVAGLGWWKLLGWW